MAGAEVFLPATVAIAALTTGSGLAGLTAADVWADKAVFNGAATLTATVLGALTDVGLEGGRAAGFLVTGVTDLTGAAAFAATPGLEGAAALARGWADFLTTALTPAGGWVALAAWAF